MRMTRCFLMLVLAAVAVAVAVACAPPVQLLETCVATERGDAADLIAAGEQVGRFSGVVISDDEASLESGDGCSAAAAGHSVVTANDDNRVRLSWFQSESDLALPVTSGTLDVELRNSWPQQLSIVLRDADGLLAAFNPIDRGTSPELDEVSIVYGDWLGTHVDGGSVVDETNIAARVGDERTVVGPGKSATIEVDGASFTLHAFRASRMTVVNCEDCVDILSWALVRDR